MKAFVLSGGSSLGAIQVGMLRALYERGIAAELIVATSAGGLNGAYIASRPPTLETIEAPLRQLPLHPRLFPIVEHGECRLVGGAVADNTPIDHAIERGAAAICV